MNRNGKVSIGKLAVVGISLLCLVLIVSSILPIPVTIRGGGFLSIGTSYKAYAAPDWLSGYDYRKEIPVGSATGAGVNYTVKITGYYDANEAFTAKWSSGSLISGTVGDLARNIIVEGDYLYGVTADQKQLVVYNVSNIDSPVKLNQTTMTRRGVDLRYKESGGDEWLFVSSDSGVAVWNVTDPENPTEDNHLSLQHDSEDAHVHGMFLSGNYLYCSHHRCDRFTVVNITEPTNPVEEDYLEGSTYFNGCHDCHVEGNYAYVTNYLAAGGQYGFVVVDITDKEDISVEGYTCTNKQFSHLVKTGDKLLVGCHGPNTAGLHVVDVTTPSSPSQDGQYLTDRRVGYWMDWWDSSTIVARTSVIATGTIYLALIDVSNLSNPTIITEENFNDDIGCVHVNSNRVFESGQDQSGPTYYWYIKSFAVEGPNFDGHCQTDFDDIRFTDNDGVTELSYWIESKTDSDNAVFWVKVADNISSSNTTIYAYYGNSTVSTTSNIYSTFVLADDFFGSSLNTSKWDEAGAGSVAVSGGECTLTNLYYITSKTSYTGGYAMRTRIKTGSDTTTYWWTAFVTTAGTGTNKYMDFSSYETTQTYFRQGSGDDVAYDTQDSGIARDTAYHIHEIKRTGTADKFSVDDESDNTGSHPTNAARYCELHAYNADAVVDWIVVRKYVLVEPEIGTWGSAETQECSPSYIISPGSWNVNGGSPVSESSSYSTGLTAFNVTNNSSGGAIDITIGAGNMTGGGYTWVLSNTATPGDMTYGLKAGLSGESYNIIVKQTAPYNTLVSNLADDSSQLFGLILYTPTNFDDGNSKSGGITLTVVCS